MKKLQVAALTVVGILGGSSAVRAELWTPLDSIPRPNGIIGISHGVTAGMEMTCSGHHPTRLSQVKSELTTTLDIFERYFVFGGFTYNGCGSANVDWRLMPNPTNPTASYNTLVATINGLGECGSGEKSWPGGGNSVGTCLMPAFGCSDDAAVVQQIGNSGGLVGMAIPPPINPLPVACDRAGAPVPTYDLQASMIAKLGTMSWNHLSVGNAAPPPGQVLTDFCDPLAVILNQVKNELDLCLLDTAGIEPTDVWDMSFLGGPQTAWCDHNVMAPMLCSTPATGSPPGLQDSCVCDSGNPLCAVSIPVSDCGVPGTTDPYPWNRPAMQQQVAVCEAYNSGPGRFGAYFASQTDNRVNSGCRENVAMFVTDGLHGQVWPVGVEASNALTGGAYWSISGLSNMFVFNTANVVFSGQADVMMDYVSNGAITTAYSAHSLAAFEESFATVLSRIYKGVYTGGTMGTDDLGTRLAIHSATVPGYSATSPITDSYHGFLARVSVFELDPAGNLLGAPNPVPRYETDWANKNSLGNGVPATAVCGPATWLGVAPAGSAERDLFGPDGSFRNGVPRTRSLATGQIDRDGARNALGAWLVTPSDTIPAAAGGGVIIGKNNGFAGTPPIFVARPRDPGINGYDLQYATFISNAAVRQRPQALYFADGAYVVGVHAGSYRSPAPASFGYQKRAYDYDDSVADAGKEILRYRPSWVDLPEPTLKYRYDINDLVQQPGIVGTLVAREVRLQNVNNGSAVEWRTVLLGNQGWTGPGFFALDISEPCNIKLMAEWQMPNGSFASATPSFTYWQSALDPVLKPVVITTSGLDATNNAIYAYDIATGALLSTTNLPAGPPGSSYPTAPACIDVTGKGFATHCYVLRSDGFLARIRIGQAAGNGQFLPYAASDNVTPVDGGGTARSMTGGQIYSTAPVAYFDAKGQVNLVFGSGDHRNLTAATPQNHLYRAVDRASRQSGVPVGPMHIDNLCINNGNTDGEITFGADERLLSAPTVANNIVAFATYHTSSSGCSSGTGQLYLMNAETCKEANSSNPPALRPAGAPIGEGIPTSPVYHRQSGSFIVGGSAKPTGSQTTDASTTNSRDSRYLHRKLYFRVGAL